MKARNILSFLFALIGVLIYLFQHQIHVLLVKAGGFATKSVCSGVFVSKRLLDSNMEAYELSVVPPLIVSLEVVGNQVKSYTISKWFSELFGLPIVTATFVSDQLGCVLNVSDSKFVVPPNRKFDVLTESLPENISPAISAGLAHEFTKEAFYKNQTRAVVVLHKGQVVYEHYQSLLGLGSDSKLLGWSMTKSAHSAIIGAAIQAGYLQLQQPARLSFVSEKRRQELTALNGGRAVTIADLLQMNNVLEIEENYGMFGDIAEMLYTVDSAAQMASNKRTRSLQAPHPRLQRPAAEAKDTHFTWYYSSGVSNLLAQELREAIHDDEKYFAFPWTHLFEPIGAHSFTIEPDPSGTFVASSFGYATARDWARLGQLFLNKGVWAGRQILPKQFVEFIRAPHPLSGGHYGGQFWLNPAAVSVAEYTRLLPVEHPDKRKRAWMPQTLPADAYSMNGFLGQYTTVIPSLDVVIVRLGFTRDQPDGTPANWDAHVFFRSILDNLPSTPISSENNQEKE